MTKYKITATVIKPGNTPTNWTRFTENEMTKEECEKILSARKEASDFHETSVTLTNFKCVRAGA